ncbi:MAG: sigma-54-dependent Fis family transcriptional regulator, partial [Nitrospirae bacterium]|nr:sigma-54-dependent Fis family transcriptional regulator [Nitrospirota bacterium]
MEKTAGNTYLNRLLGSSAPMKQLLGMLNKVAQSDSTVLLNGESGTGKELAAKAIHYTSQRATFAFVPVNCGAIPKDLLESELFGHEKGAFTGAITTRRGRFELADQGTIMLDEIGELHPSLQVKLLRVLQEREFERVGGMKTIKVDVRILAATNKNLEEMTRQGLFREDLFYRLNVIPIKLPPLRERKEDIPLLLDHFLNIFCEKQGIKRLNICDDTIGALLRYPWPGNVRELEALVERFVILNENGTITLDDLPERFHQSKKQQALTPTNIVTCLPAEGLDLNALLDEIEKDLILQALDACGGVKNKAANMLGLNRTT